nr:ImmA/IrrE family metallo-endopeptidase [Pelagibacterium xiamenense]
MHAKTLAEHLEIPVRPLSTHDGVPDEIKTFWQTNGEDTFSGVTINDGTYKEIVYNDFHHPRRQNSDIAHELAHIVLGHTLTAPIKANGERDYDRAIEEEAKWLGATLLLPKKALIHVILNGMPIEAVRDEYGVSESLYRFRAQVTDAFRAAKNTRRKYGTAAE